MVAGGVDEHSTLVPCAALHADVLMDGAQVLQLAVTHSDGCTHARTHTVLESYVT